MIRISENTRVTKMAFSRRRAIVLQVETSTNQGEWRFFLAFEQVTMPWFRPLLSVETLLLFFGLVNALQ